MYLKAIIACIIAILSFSALSAQSDNVVIDTITVYDPATKSETVTIVKSIDDKVVETDGMVIQMDTVTTYDADPPYDSRVKVVKNYYNKKTGKSNAVTKDYGPGSKLVPIIDTVITFNPATYEERIEVVKSFEIQSGN